MSRRGMTLVEMLVAMTATLLLMAAVAQAFGVFGNAITASRSILEFDGRMREAAWRLRGDLAGATARPLPPLGPDAGEGYFEIIEGPLTDARDAMTGLAIVSGVTPIGPTDVDDVLMFTTFSANPPFVGRGPTAGTTAAFMIDTFESSLAEVAWFARMTPGSTNPVTFTLYRKQLLVMGYVGTDPFYSQLGGNNAIRLPASHNGQTISDLGSAIAEFLDLPCDISIRRERDFLFPNTLADLTRREARFMHNRAGVVDGTAFPYPFVNHQAVSLSPAAEQLPAGLEGLVFDVTSQRRGEDVVLTNVLAFDVRVFDPGAPVTIPGGTPLAPGDPGYTGAAVASGAWVDLGHGAGANALLPTGVSPHFAGNGALAATLPRTYDTWSLAYEANGRDEDGVNGVDQSINGLDDNGDGIIDDPGEFETRPPYPHALRGIEVRIRCYEPSSQQVRQVTIRHSFVPH